MLYDVYHRIEDIAQANATTTKLAKLREYAALSPLFRRVMFQALSDHTTFHVSTFPDVSHIESTGADTDTYILNKLDEFANSRGVTDIQILELAVSAKRNSVEVLELVRRICNKDLRCGVSATNANKAYPGIALVTPYMRCSTRDKLPNIKFPAYAQLKCDGAFCYIIKHDNNVNFITRKGSSILGLDSLASSIRNISGSFVLSGELQVSGDDGDPLPRSISNGIVNKAIKGTATPHELDMMFYTAWDLVAYSSFLCGKAETKYCDRFAWLVSTLRNMLNHGKLFAIDNFIVDSIDDINNLYNKVRSEGSEGLVVKNCHGKWKSGTSQDQIKLKNESECELVVTGWGYGKPHTKYEKCMGSVNAESACGQLKVALSGFTDAQRQANWNDYVGTIIEVKYESVSKSGDKTTYSLSHPRFSKFRFDRNIADTLNDILTR